ncbi:MAG: FHA domain-containing protein [Propionivibrio sp.]
MSKEKRSFVLCAKLRRTGACSPTLDEVMAGQPAVHRMNRVERVALAYDGELVRRTNELLLIAFKSATAAVLGACEMQRRCAGMPQVAGDELALGIGIHKASPPIRARAALSLLKPSERRDFKRRFGFDVAAQLADQTLGNCVVISSLVAGMLDPELLDASQNERNKEADLSVHLLDWRKVLIHSVLAPGAAAGTVANRPRPSTYRIMLGRGSDRRQFGADSPIASFGRDPGCDVVIGHQLASRLHARIEITDDGCILTDHSANGTCIQMPDGIEVLIRDKSFLLPMNGRIAFGHVVRDRTDAAFDFEIVAA